MEHQIETLGQKFAWFSLTLPFGLVPTQFHFYLYTLKNCFFSIEYAKASGLAVLSCGVWMQHELTPYMRLNWSFLYGVPFIFISTGTLILFIGSLACCCTLKGQPSLLHLVKKKTNFPQFYWTI